MTTDDTFRTGKQAQEDTWMAQLEAGLLENMSFTRATSDEDVETIVHQAEDACIMLFRIHRETAEEGMIGGLNQGMFLVHLATKGVVNKVALAFDGWADDPRELWEIPVVTEFCRGLLGEAGSDYHKAICTVLVDEASLAIKGDRIVDPTAFQIAGSLWLVGIAYPDGILRRDATSSTGQLRDIGRAIELRMKMWEGS